VDSLTGEASTRPPEEIARWEAGLLAVSRRWFATIRPGDDAAIAAVLARDHPVYADHPPTTLAELAAMVARRPPARDLDRTRTPIIQFGAARIGRLHNQSERQIGGSARVLFDFRSY
jgi:hypothetical protein